MKYGQSNDFEESASQQVSLMSRKIHVAGVGTFPAIPEPGESNPMLSARPPKAALDDARIDCQAVNQTYAGYVYGDSCIGQVTVHHTGFTRVPVVNVNNNCATGPTAPFLARQAMVSGACLVTLYQKV